MSDMKCPFCGEKLEPCYGFGMELYSCSNLPCKGSYMQAEDSVWQELIRTRKALDVSVDALKSAHEYYQNCVIREKRPQEINWHCTAMNMDNDIFEAIEQITALTKGGSNE